MKEGIKYIDYYIPEHSLAISSLIDQIETKNIPAVFADKKQYIEFVKEVLSLVAFGAMIAVHLSI